MNSEQHFQVDLRGIIDLLSDHLYSGPQVYIRELMQNAVDALTARRMNDPTFRDDQIRLEIIRPAQVGQPPTLIVTDNGIGLTEQEVHQFLATIGKSSKRDFRREDFIGQFGIGLLSGFVVCEEIVVITRSVRDGQPTLEWKGRADGTYSVRTLDHTVEPGTQVYLRAKPGCHEFLEADFVRKMARHFGRHLPVDIQVICGNQRERIHESPPWKPGTAGDALQRDDLLEYGQNVLDQQFLDAVPLRSDTGGVQGVAFILPHTSRLQSKRGHRVYLKNMLLSETVDNLLPDWAFFVKCVVNTTGLRPTANREGFYEDETLEIARSELGTCLKRYLMRLADHDRDRLNSIIALHHLPIKALAVDDDEFFELFIDWLPFETSLGEMALGDYRRQHSGIRYVRSRDQFRQISSVTAAQKLCIIDAAYTYDAELLEKLAALHPEVSVELVDVSELAQEFEDLTLDERESIFDFIKLANVVLQPFQCSVDIRRFRPDSLPALYTVNDEASFLRSVEQSKEGADDLWSGLLDNISQSQTNHAQALLCLNFRNPLIGRLSQLRNRELLKRAVEMLYVQSLLMGHYPLKPREMTLLNDGLLGLIEAAME
ncbi:MAG: HSP90 family protein [Planctomycetaceae bacterium]